MKRYAAALAATALAFSGSAPTIAQKVIGQTEDKALVRHMAMIAQARDLVKAHRPKEAIPIAAQVIAETDARLSGEKRHVYSGQNTQMLLANMMGAASAKQDAVDVGPPLGEALFYEGFALIDADRASEAGPFLDRAVTVSPNNPQYLCEAGAWHAKQQALDLAASLYERCEQASRFATGETAQADMAARAQRGRGYVLVELGRLDEAEAVYRARLKADPKDEKAQNELRYIREQRAGSRRDTV